MEDKGWFWIKMIALAICILFGLGMGVVGYAAYLKAQMSYERSLER